MTSWMNFKKTERARPRHLHITHILSVLTLLLFAGLAPSPALAITGTDVSPGDACTTEDAVMMTANASGSGGYIMTCESSVWVATMSAGLPTANEHVANKEYVDTVAAAGGGDNGRFQSSCWADGSSGYNYCVITDTATGQTSCRTSYRPYNSSYPWTDCGGGNLNVSSISGGSIVIPESGGGSIYAANAYGWGSGNYVGDGTGSGSYTPKSINLNLTFTKIDAGYNYGCGIASSKPYCWGFNAYDSYYNPNLGTEETGAQTSPIALNLSSLGYPSITDISVGQTKGAIRSSSGEWYSWGRTYLNNIYYDFGGTAYYPSQVNWYNTSNSTAQLPNDFTKVELGVYHVCALRSNGNIHCASQQDGSAQYPASRGNGPGGCQYSQQRSLHENCPVSGGHTFVDVAIAGTSSYITSCGAANDGEVYCWGYYNNYGQLGTGNTTNSDGTPTAVDKSISGSVTFEKVYGGGHITSNTPFFCALDTDGKAYCWGRNYYGQLGTGDTSDRNKPTPVLGNYSFDSLSLGDQQACGVTTNGTLYCWGYNAWGQLGNGSASQKLIPEPVSGGSGFVGVTTGYQSAYAWK